MSSAGVWQASYCIRVDHKMQWRWDADGCTRNESATWKLSASVEG
jgi:hypothetical protein